MEEENTSISRIRKEIADGLGISEKKLELKKRGGFDEYGVSALDGVRTQILYYFQLRDAQDELRKKCARI